MVDGAARARRERGLPFLLTPEQSRERERERERERRRATAATDGTRDVRANGALTGDDRTSTERRWDGSEGCAYVA